MRQRAVGAALVVGARPDRACDGGGIGIEERLYGGGQSQGYLFFALKGTLVFLIMLVVLVGHDMYSLIRSGTPFLRIVQARAGAIAVIISLTTLFVVTAASSAGLIIQALFG